MVDTTNFTDEEKAEYELFLKIKNSPEYGILPLPARWYEKFNIEPMKAMNTRDFIESRYTLKCAFAPKDLPPIIIKEPQQNGKMVELMKEEEIPVYIIEKPYDPDNMMTEDEILEKVKEKTIVLE